MNVYECISNEVHYVARRTNTYIISYVCYDTIDLNRHNSHNLLYTNDTTARYF